MALGTTPRSFPISDAFTVDDLLTIAETLRRDDTPRDHEIKVLTRVGLSRAGQNVRQLNIVPPARPGNGGQS